MTVADLSRIDKDIEINATPDRVWRALTTADELSTWFQVAIEGEITPGGEVWMTSVHPEHRGQRFLVKIVELSKPHRVVWEWHPGEADPKVDYSREPRTTVTFTLRPTDRGTRVAVSETGFDAIAIERRGKVYKDNTQGWTEVLVWLQRHVEAAH
jgi:uncharacterized protein YndB with AHSA1/START domain